MKSESGRFSELVPARNIKWETGEDGRIFLLKEKSGNKLMKRLIGRFGKSQFFRIHLDEIGSMVWDKIDGKNTVREIGEYLREEKGEAVVPQAVARVETFIAIMLKNRFIKFPERK